MGPSEVAKRVREHLQIYYSRFKYKNPSAWPYRGFAARYNAPLKLFNLPGLPVDNDWENYPIYNLKFDLTKKIDWYFSEQGGVGWPFVHYSKINYRPGNPYGDIRINWELNRLQFLPVMAVSEEKRAKEILNDWMIQNSYLYGPCYAASMEVAIRWISIFRAICLFKEPVQETMMSDITGLAIGSGKFIESRLSTHSSAGNHLIVESVGLFWIGRALEKSVMGRRWMDMSRKILHKQILRQLNGDGSNQEQCFWYLGFVLDAIFHYLLLEDRENIPDAVWQRMEKCGEFVYKMVTVKGDFPDYGDRDDGFIFRVGDDYDVPPFPGLLNIGAFFFNRLEWEEHGVIASNRAGFFRKDYHRPLSHHQKGADQKYFKRPEIECFPEGGMTLMRRGKGKLLFRHARLGLGNTCGHGHADALSVLFSWQGVPVLIDLGSGQYNRDQKIRNYFRSTIAHNTVEIGGGNQAKILGPFLWEKSYETKLKEIFSEPDISATAEHTGYVDDYFTIHNRRISWENDNEIRIHDAFYGPGGFKMRGAFHFGPACVGLNHSERCIMADFNDFEVRFMFSDAFEFGFYYGDTNPFLGWRSTIYGNWEPIHALIFSKRLSAEYQYDIKIRVVQ